MMAEADRNPRQNASASPMGDSGVLVSHTDRDGAEVGRSLTFLQGNLLIAVSGITPTEAVACGSGAVNALANILSRGLRFSDGEPAAADPPGADASAVLAGAQPVGPDRCVVGTWSLSRIEGMEYLLQQVAQGLATEEARVELAPPALSGTQFLTVEADSSLWVENNLSTTRLMSTVYGVGGDWLDTTVETIHDGSAAGMVSFYRRGGETLIWALLDLDDITKDVVVTQEGYI
jgi:hypothetical protein